MNIFNSSISGEIIEPEELINFIVTEFSLDQIRNIRMWRGQSNIKWPIHSGGYRRLANTEGKEVIKE